MFNCYILSRNKLGSHEDVVKIVDLACKHNVVIIPVGG